MKICHLMTKFVKGGATTYITNLIKGVDANHSLVCGPLSEKDLLTELENQGVKTHVETWLSQDNPIKLFFSIFRLTSYFRKNKFDIIHTNSTPAGLAGRVAGKLAGCKVIHTAHAAPFENRKNKRILILAEWVAAFFCDIIIDVSPRIRKLYEERRIGLRKHKTILVGIEIDDYINAKKIKLPCPSKDFKIVTVSRLVKGKGLEKFISIANSLKSHKNFSFIIVGEGESRNELEKKAENKKILFLGHKENVPSILKSCDIFLFLSEREGAPLAIYEAMAAGLPVVSTRRGGIPDQITNEKTGFLVSNSTETKTRLLELYKSEKLRNSMGKKSQKKVKQNTVKNIVSNTEKIYQSLYL